MLHLHNFKLFEKNISAISYSDVITKAFIDLQDQKGYLDPYASQYYAEEFNEFLNWEDEPDKIAEIIKSDDFKNWLQYELETRFDTLQYKFEKLIEDGQITLYRALAVESDYINKLNNNQIKRIGRYFTYDFNKAEPHWGYNQSNKNNIIIFEIKINEEYVDWLETFRLNLEHEFYNEEDEIRLFKNTPINITNIWWNNKELDNKEKILNNNYSS